MSDPASTDAPARMKALLYSRFGELRGPLFAVFVVVAFALFLDTVGLAGFAQAWEQAVLLIAGCMGIALMKPFRAPGTRSTGVILVLIGVALVLLRTVQMINAVGEERQPSIDIGTTTIAAVDAYAEGRNPYTEPLDPVGQLVDPEGQGLRYFGGYKYGPLMTVSYLPAVRAWGAQGLFLMNWLALIATAVAAAFWASAGAGRLAAAGAAALVLVPRFLDPELFTSGVTDLVPVALGMTAFALGARQRDVPAGAMVGLSIATKLMPGVLFAVALLAGAKDRGRMAVAMLVAAIVPHIPFLIDSPRELLSNLVIFNLARPFADPSPLQGVTPGLARSISFGCAILAVVLLPLMVERGRLRDVRLVAATVALGLAIFLFGSKAFNRNYLLWVLPAAATAVATKVWATDPREDMLRRRAVSALSGREGDEPSSTAG